MSKHRSVDVGNTLFGKVKLDPSCIACDRPFGAAAQARNGIFGSPASRFPHQDTNCCFFRYSAREQCRTSRERYFPQSSSAFSIRLVPRQGYSWRRTSSPVGTFTTAAGRTGCHGGSTADTGHTTGKCIVVASHTHVVLRGFSSSCILKNG